jgi:hypothetical protein
MRFWQLFCQSSIENGTPKVRVHAVSPRGSDGTRGVTKPQLSALTTPDPQALDHAKPAARHEGACDDHHAGHARRAPGLKRSISPPPATLTNLTCLPPSPTSTEPSPPACSATPRPSCLPPCPASARSTSLRSSLRSVWSWTVWTPSSRPSLSAAPPPSPERPARPRRWGFAGPPTGEHELRCTPSPTTPGMPHLGRQAVCRCPPARQAPRPRDPDPPRAWLRVMWACWHTDTAYDPARHRAEQRLAA